MGAATLLFSKLAPLPCQNELTCHDLWAVSVPMLRVGAYNAVIHAQWLRTLGLVAGRIMTSDLWKGEPSMYEEASPGLMGFI